MPKHGGPGSLPAVAHRPDRVIRLAVSAQAIEKIKALSEERQEYEAAALEEIAEDGDDLYRLSDEERALVREGLAELDRGEAATDAEVQAVYAKYRK